MTTVLFEVTHPKHFLQFRRVISALGSRHRIHVLAREKDVLLDLLEHAGVQYERYNRPRHGLLRKALGIPAVLAEYLHIIDRIQPDLIVSRSSPYAALLSKAKGIKTLVMPDSEGVSLNERFVIPWSTFVVSPATLERDYGEKHFRISSFFEAAYLHPSHFRADRSIRSELGVGPDERFAVLRFVSWGANHDAGQSGIGDEQRRRLVESLSPLLRVFISAEGVLAPDLEAFRLPTGPSQIHQVLEQASLYVGDSQSMATEAALLGTPAVRCNSFVGPGDFSNFRVLEQTHGMLYNYLDLNDALRRAIELAQSPAAKKRWVQKRDRYFSSVGDVNEETVAIIERLI